MIRGLLVLGLFTLGAGSLTTTAAEVPGPQSRFSYGKIVWVDKVITCKCLQWREEKVERQVVKCCPEIRPVKRVVMVPREFDSCRMVVDITTTPRCEIRDVPCSRLVPVLMYDNLTHCCFMATRRECYTVKVKCNLVDTNVCTRKVPIKVCRMCPEVRTFNEPVPVPRTETVCELRRVAVYVPVQKCVRVPVCMPSDVPVPLGPNTPPPLPPGPPVY